MHHNEAYFKDPFEFKLERWLEDETSRDAFTIAHSAFTPFGVGCTSFAGKYIAYQEMAIVLARMISLYDLRLEPGISLGAGSEGLGKGKERKNEFQTDEKFVSSHDGPMVQFRKNTSTENKCYI